MTEEQIEKAGKMLKIVSLASNPMMDNVAIKLNCGLTWREKESARRWAKAFELAQTDESVFDCAAKLAEEFTL